VSSSLTTRDVKKTFLSEEENAVRDGEKSLTEKKHYSENEWTNPERREGRLLRIAPAKMTNRQKFLQKRRRSFHPGGGNWYSPFFVQGEPEKGKI